MNTKLLEKKMENISPFELKNRLIDMADESLKKTARTMLNAGRGNPNWIATTPREAFFLLGKFGLEECRHVMFLPEGIAGIPEKQGIAARFEQFLKSNTYQPGAKLLEQTYHYMLMQHAVDPDSLVHEWAESVIGNQYPVPDRILQFTEMLVCDYLNQEMCDNRPPRGAFNLFATEGGTAAMCYIFDSLQENFLLDKGDGIALMVPAFTPYIEIPQLDRYRFKVTELHANRMSKDGLHLWQYSDEDIDRLKNPAIKALFVTNPKQPAQLYAQPRNNGAHRKHRKGRQSQPDDYYGRCVRYFQPAFPLVYGRNSVQYALRVLFLQIFRRYRLAQCRHSAARIQCIRQTNIPIAEREARRPSTAATATLTLHPEKLKFIDRMVADSRQVALEPYGRTFIASTDADEPYSPPLPCWTRRTATSRKCRKLSGAACRLFGTIPGFTLSGRPLTGRLLYGNRHAGLGRRSSMETNFVEYLKTYVQSAERSIPPCSKKPL